MFASQNPLEQDGNGHVHLYPLVIPAQIGECVLEDYT